MLLQYKLFEVRKAGEETSDDYGRISLTENEGTKKQKLIAAVSDGATTSSYSNIWANLLVDAFIEKPYLHSKELLDNVSTLSERWWKDVRQKDLPWYAEEKLAQGSFATFIGMKLNHAPGNPSTTRYTIIAVGDSCFFHIRNNQLYKSFPVADPDEFSSHAYLVPTQHELIAKLEGKIHRMAGSCQPGDTLVLATDAFSHWFLKSFAEGTMPMAQLEEAVTCDDSGQAFEELVNSMRQSGQMRNDDVVTIVLKIR